MRKRKRSREAAVGGKLPRHHPSSESRTRTLASRAAGSESGYGSAEPVGYEKETTAEAVQEVKGEEEEGVRPEPRSRDDDVSAFARWLVRNPTREGYARLQDLARTDPGMLAAVRERLERWREDATAGCGGGGGNNNGGDDDRRARLARAALELFGAAAPRTGDEDEAECDRLLRALVPRAPWRAFPYPTLQTFPTLRWEWREIAGRALGGPSVDGCAARLRRTLVLGPELGEGSSGVVRLARIASLPGSYPVAVKLPLGELRPRDSEAERRAGSAANALVAGRACPNFVMLLHACADPAPERGRVFPYYVTELADAGDAERLLGGGEEGFPSDDGGAPRSMLIASAAVQMFMAIVALSYLDIAHNDMYLRNVLYNRVEPVWLRYRALGTEFVVPTLGRLAKVADFGLATSGSIGRPHSERGLDDLPFDAGEHVARTRMPPFARDAFALLVGLVAAAGEGLRYSPLGRWLRSARSAVGRMAREWDPALGSPEGLRTTLRVLLDAPIARAVLRAPEFVPPRGARILTFDVDGVPHILARWERLSGEVQQEGERGGVRVRA